MKAAVLDQVGARFRIADVPVPKLRPDEVLVETRTCGICRTDLHIQDGLAYIPEFPHIPGHEAAGVVAGVGERVEGITLGTPVVPHLFLTCGRCSYCRTGRDAQCSRAAGILGVTVPGGFAEYMKVPARNLLPLPRGVSFEAGGLVSCAIITAVHACRRARLAFNDLAVVLGLGGIGQILVQLLVAAGIRVAAVDRSSETRSAAERDGAVWSGSLETGVMIRQIKDISEGEGAHCIFECVGTAKTMKAAGEMARRGGQIIVIGEEPDYPEINTIQMAQRELEIIGSRNGSVQDAADALQMLSQGLIRPPIAGRFPLDQLNEALLTLRQGRAHGRLIIQIKEG